MDEKITAALTALQEERAERYRAAGIQRYDDAIAAIQALLHGLTDGSTVAVGYAPTVAVKPAPRRTHPSPPGLEPTLPEAARLILEDAGEKLQVMEIFRRAKADRGWYPKRTVVQLRNSATGTLDRKAKAGDTFTKPEPGHYGLLSWDLPRNGSPETAESVVADSLFSPVPGVAGPTPNGTRR